MSRRKKDPLRELTDPERRELTRIARFHAAPAAEVARAAMLLAVAAGDDYQQAARQAGRRSDDAISHLVVHFNAEGTVALTSRHGGGRRTTYGPAEAARIATWSLSTLQKTLRAAPDGLPNGDSNGVLCNEWPFGDHLFP